MKEKVQGLYKELVEKEDGLQKVFNRQIEKTADEIRTDILKHQNFLEEMKEKLLYAEDTEIDDKSQINLYFLELVFIKF